MANKFTKEFSISDQLKTREMAAEYLNAALEDDDPRVLQQALRDVAKYLLKGSKRGKAWQD